MYEKKLFSKKKKKKKTRSNWNVDCQYYKYFYMFNQRL